MPSIWWCNIDRGTLFCDMHSFVQTVPFSVFVYTNERPWLPGKTLRQTLSHFCQAFSYQSDSRHELSRVLSNTVPSKHCRSKDFNLCQLIDLVCRWANHRGAVPELLLQSNALIIRQQRGETANEVGLLILLASSWPFLVLNSILLVLYRLGFDFIYLTTCLADVDWNALTHISTLV